MPAEHTEQRKLAAIMFTDMVGYSALSQSDDRLAQELLEEHRALLRSILPRFNGAEIKTIGDAFLFEFGSALEAAQCAIEIQRALAKRNHDVTPGRRIELKIGIHIGDVVHRGGDVYGDGVNIASRIEPLAGAGGICVSMDVERQIRNALEARFEKLAPTELKNISVAMDLFRIVLPWETGAKVGTRALPALKRSQALVVASVVVVLAVVVVWKLLPHSGNDQQATTRNQTNAPPVAVTNAPTRSADQKSIAVLAFANMSEDKGNEYFSDGISEELLNVLAKTPGLKVTARTSAFYFKGKQVPVAEIAQQLGVAYVVEGSVRKAGDKVRITAQLIKAADGFHVWSDTFTRDLKDIFAVQDEIAGLIAQNLELKMGVGPTATRHEVDPEALRLMLEGRYFLTPRTSAGFDQADRAFTQALKIDPQFAQAQAGLATTTALRGRYRLMDGLGQVEEFDQLAISQSRLALQWDPALAEPHATMGFVHTDTGRLDEAEQEFQKAFAANPNYATAYHWHSHVLAARGRLDLALSEIGRAEALDPVSFIILFIRGFYLSDAQQYTEALAVLDRAAAIRGESFLPLEADRAWVLMALGRKEEALAAARKVLQDPRLITSGWNAAGEALYVLQRSGAGDEAGRLAPMLLQAMPAGSYQRGYVHCALGDFTTGLRELENMPIIFRSRLFWHPMLEPIHDTPDFRQLLVKFGAVEEFKVARATLARMLKEQKAKQ